MSDQELQSKIDAAKAFEDLDENEIRRRRGDYLDEESAEANLAEADDDSDTVLSKDDLDAEEEEVDAEEDGLQAAEESSDDAEEAEAGEEEVDAKSDAETVSEADEKDDSEDKGKKEPFIPKSRFDEAQRAARQREADLARRVAELEAQQQQVVQTEQLDDLQKELDALDDKYEELVFEGKAEEAKTVRKERAAKQQELFDAKVMQQTQRTKQQALEQVRYDAMVAQYEAKYPEINPDSELFDNDLARDLAETIEAFELRGYTATAALQKAVSISMRGRPDPSAETVQEQEKVDTAEAVRNKRAVTARKRVAKVAKTSPPDLTKAGRNSDTAGADSDGLPNPLTLTEKQFEKLTEEQIKKMRGDYYVGE